jgi:hypothetical protein
VTPTEALRLFTDHCTATMPLGRRFEFDAAHEALRKLVVDDIARKKNQDETEKIVRPF